ncbi:acyl-CoA thioesterase [Streptomyces sp. NBC_01808]|uniref:acyl-CoA thioesterase n=1 Tax=Streptomyces sp. NBC_01808 TaxID=2975947 RepID=UPI002DD851E7|nr:thioesterase family protein [Streptomyces sp. NBC_01808]WSA40284.1 acyl-CoA thioesterase [Streptomyces sp. NBC_01808]
MTRTEEITSLPSTDVGVLVPVTVNYDDLDPMGMLHNSRYQVLVERAWVTYWGERGFISESGLDGDAFNVVKTFTITFDFPIRKIGEFAVHLWMERLGNTSSTAGYRVCSADGGTTYAHGSRTIVCIDVATLTPTPWSDRARKAAQALVVPHGGA